MCATKTSKACWGSRGLSCIHHDIRCNSNQQIAIYDAYYTGNTECGAALTSCTVNLDNVTERGHHRFNNTELVSLYNHCSTETQCVYRATRRSAGLTFSVVRYLCTEKGDLLNISGGVAEGLSQVSLTHGDQRIPNSTPQTDNYTCSFKSNVAATSISVYALDARSGRGTPGQCFSKLSVLPGDVITTNNCSSVFQPFERLNVRAELPTFLYFIDIPRSSLTLIWLLINASDPFDVKCEQAASAGGFTTESTNSTSPISTSRQFPGEFNTAPDKDRYPISISSQFPAGVFVGGVAVGVVIVILVCLAVYVLVVRRRYDLTPKKQGDTPASIEHPSYSGMSAGGDVNNYDIIEQTSGFQGDTAHDVAATPDYQNL
ncbi:uncharacterized protein LOC124139992 [Haliotis rufescens]|uniref:uncharacterized protein LOC124139992 n=1 Tax=Haliotis rufescens TaxID=6454 RepID=UPI00201F07DF|nr:uncharacterized protein LOC124139992 [Haliotis rufescens]